VAASRPVLIPQADSPPDEILGFGVGEDDPAILGQKEHGETGGRDRRAERTGCCSRPGEEVMDRHRALQMRPEGFQEMPFRRFHPNRLGRSLEGQISERFGRAKKTDSDKFGPSLRPDEFIAKSRGFERVGLADGRRCPHLARSDCRRGCVKGVYLVVMLDECVGIERIGIAQCRQMCRIPHMNEQGAAHRFRRLDDALNDAVPTRRFDDGIVNRRDQIIAAV
jgi:hypothetical protein